MGQTTNKGEAIGVWTLGGRVYASDMSRINEGVARGKYLSFVGTNIPEGYEAWIYLDGPPPVSYARKLSRFKTWWMQNKAGIVAKVVKAAGVGWEKVSAIAAVVLPILLDASANAAKIAVSQHFANDPTAMAVAEAIITQVKNAPDGANPAAVREISGSGQRRNHYAGGVLAKFGGGDEEVDMTLLNNYVNSANSKGKKHIIDALVEVAEGLKMKVSGSTPEEKVKSIMANLPQPGQFKKETHKVACEAIAMRLNKAYGSEIVSLKLPAEVICQEISEVLNSLASGMHSEFIAVYNDARRILRNLQILSKTLEESHNKLVAELRAGDEGSRARVANYESIHEVIKSEINRQTAMLTGILNATLAPVDAELSKVMRAGGIKSLVANVDTEGPGTAEFSKFLAEIVKGMGVTAHFAALIENALKTVGMTMQEYAASKSTQEFRSKIAKGMSSRDMNDKQFDEYLRAAELLFDNLERREDIRDVAARSGAGDDRAEVVGGDPEYEKSTIERRLENRRTERNLYFNTFHKEVNALFDGLLGNINVLSNKVGAEVPLSENLDQFRRCLQRVAYEDEKLLRKGGIYKALLGYFTDADSKQKKEEFVNKLRMLSSSAATLAEMSIYASARQYFTDVVTQVGAIIKLIESYSEKMQSKFGRGEVTGGADDITGGALDEEPRLKYKAAKSIEESIEMFDFKYRLANIKENLKISAEETPKFFEGHENKVATSIGNYLAEEKIKYEALKVEAGKIVSASPFEDKGPGAISADEVLAKGVGATDELWNKQRVAAAAVLDEIWETKKSFWLTIEAIDAYLREFTNGMVKNPDDIRDIRSMVENVEVIAEWYNEKSGNNLSDVFSKFPHNLRGASYKNIDNDYEAPAANADDHPYKKLETKATPGNPLNVTDPISGRGAFDLAEKTVRSFGLLKNFVSVFNKIGAKFGGEALSKKIPMTPATMYENLVKFLRVGSFVQGYARAYETGKAFPIVNREMAGVWASDDIATAEANMCNTKLNFADITASAAEATATADFEIVGVGCKDAFDAKQKSAANFRKRWGVWMDMVYNRRNAKVVDLRERVGFGFDKEHEYFVLAIKALASKLFTIINLQEIMVRPSDYSGLTTARVILGSSDEIPKVEKGALPLYLRLLLLAQFYKKLFGNKPYNAEGDYTLPSNHTTFKISLIPEIGGVFSEVMRIVFRKNRGIDHAAYNDDDVKEWIRAVNLVYQKTQSSGKSDTATQVIHDFVAEINRRYGIISNADVMESDKEINDRYKHADHTDIDQVADEIPLLEGEGDDLPSRPSASVRYLADTIPAANSKKSRYQLMDDHREILRKFRNGFETYFENADDEHSLGNAIHLAQTKLDAVQDDAARFRIVASLIRGVDVYNKTDSAKYLYFHENVVTGLNTLSAIHSMLARFRQVAVGLDITAILKTLTTQLGMDGAEQTPAAVATAYTKVLKDTRVFPVVDNSVIDTLSIFGGYTDENKGTVDVLLGGNTVEILDTCDVTGGTHKFNAKGKATTLFNILHDINAPALVAMDPWVKDADSSKEEMRKTLQAYIRYGISNHYIMRTIVESLFALNDVYGNLVTVKIEDGMLYVNFNSVKELVNGLFKHISHSIELVRPYLSDVALKPYVDKGAAGSYYWLHEQLVEKLFVGRSDSTEAVTNNEHLTLDECAKKLSDTYKHLTRKWDVIIKDSAAVAVADADESNNRISYAHLFAEMVHYDVSKNSEIARASNDSLGNEAPKVVDFLTNNMDALLLSVAPDGKKQLDTRYSIRFKQLYSWNKELNFNRSALMMFNQLIAQFLQNNYDPVTAKMYAGVLKEFNQSGFNRAIIDHTYTYPDMPPALVAKSPGMVDDQLDSDEALGYYLSTTIRKQISDVKTFINKSVNSATIRANFDPDYLKMTSLLSTDNLAIGSDLPLVRLCTFRAYALLIRSAFLDMKLAISSQAAGAVRKNYLDLRRNNGALSGLRWMHIMRGLLYNFGVGDGANDGAGTDTLRKLVTELGLNLDTTATAEKDKITEVLTIEKVEDWIIQCAYNGAFIKYNTNAANIAAAVSLTSANIPIGVATSPQKMHAMAKYLLKVNRDKESVSWPSFASKTIPETIAFAIDGYAKVPEEFEFLKIIYNRSGAAPAAVGANIFDAVVITGGLTELLNDETSGQYKRFISVLVLISQKEYIKDPAKYKARLEELRRLLVTPPALKHRASVETSTLVKNEELATLNKSQLAKNELSLSSTDRVTLFLAREEAILNMVRSEIVAKNSTNLIPVPGGSGDPGIGTNNDKVNSLQKLTGRGDPDGDHVLYTSLARIVNTLVSARTTAGTPYYLQENIADIPSYMKERMRANLPAFSALFHALMQRCEFLKRLLDKSEINADRADLATKPFINPYPYVLKAPSGSDQEIKTRYNGILDSISKGCAAIIKSCEQTVREIGDSEVYLETYQGSIKDYKLQNMTDPLMPISSLLAVFNNVTADNHTQFLPFHSLGDDAFKFMYGTRLLLHKLDKQPLLEHAPGYMQLVESFNLMADDKFREDKKAAEEYFKMLMSAIRFIYATKHLRGSIVSSVTDKFAELKPKTPLKDEKFTRGSVAKQDLVVGEYLDSTLRTGTGATSVYSTERDPPMFTADKVPSDMSIVSQKLKVTAGSKSVYAIDRSITEVIRLTESTAKEDRIKDIVTTIVKKVDVTDSVEMRNIIDLNIVPINVHALARDIPLATLYNYGYTFDRMAAMAYVNLGVEGTRKFIDGANDNSLSFNDLNTPAKLMTALMINPYFLFKGLDTDGADRSLHALTHMMMAGVNGDGLGRPKYISDQVFNKVMFGELYPDPESVVLSGPSGDERGIRRDWFRQPEGKKRQTTVDAITALHEIMVNNLFRTDIVGVTAAIIEEVVSVGVTDAITDNPYSIVDKINNYAASNPADAKKVTDKGYAAVTHATQPQVILPHSFTLIMNALALSRGFKILETGASADAAAGAVISWLPWFMQVIKASPYVADDDTTLANIAKELKLDPETKDLEKSTKSTFNFAAEYPGYGAKASDWGGELKRQVIKFAEKVVTEKMLPKGAFRVPTLADVKKAFKDAFDKVPPATVMSKATLNTKTELTYPEGNKRKTSNKLDSLPGNVATISLTPPNAYNLYVLGRLRFDTTLVRNILFITNVYRTISHLLRKSLSYVGDEIARSMPAITSDLTEFIGTQAYTSHLGAVDKKHWRRYNV